MINVNHKFAETLIIPVIAVTPNWDFFCFSDLEKVGIIVLTRDNIRAKITRCETRSVIDLKDEIRKRYKIEWYQFLDKWYEATRKELNSLTCFSLSLQRIEEKSEDDGI